LRPCDAHRYDGTANRYQELAEAPLSIHAALMHRTRYSYDRLVSLSPQLIRLPPAPVLELVLADPSNSRALGFQLAAVADWLAEIGEPCDSLAATAAVLAKRPQALVDAVLGAADHDAADTALPEALFALEVEVGALSDAVARRYVSHVRARVLGELEAERVE